MCRAIQAAGTHILPVQSLQQPTTRLERSPQVKARPSAVEPLGTSASPLKAPWSRSAGWTALGSCADSERGSFRCRSG